MKMRVVRIFGELGEWQAEQSGDVNRCRAIDQAIE
jgi:hypothetical protein